EQDLLVRYWDAATGQETDPAVSLRGHTEKIVSIAFGSDADHLVTTSDDKTARLWDVTAAGGFTCGKGRWLNVAGGRLTSDRQRLLTSPHHWKGAAHQFELWQIPSCEKLKSFPVEKGDRQLIVLDISPDARQALIGE